MQTTNMIVYVISYVMVFLLSWISKINKNERLFNDDGDITQKPGNLLGIHLTGILWLGLVPVIQLNLAVIQVLFGNKVPETFALSTFAFVYLFAIILAGRLGQNVRRSRINSPDKLMQLPAAFFLRYFIIRASYLFVYELWFRGFLLFESINRFGTPAAVVINVFLYSLLHVFKNKKELLACIPFGLILCFFSIWFNAALPAIILHISFSLVYELKIYRNNFINCKTVQS